MAQLVEQLIRNQQVAGSNPAISSKNATDAFALVAFLVITNKSNRVRASEAMLCRGVP